MPNLSKLSDEELLAHQQELMAKRGEAEKGFREKQQEAQFEMDKRSFKKRFGDAGPTSAELAAFQELREAADEAQEVAASATERNEE